MSKKQLFLFVSILLTITSCHTKKDSADVIYIDDFSPNYLGVIEFVKTQTEISEQEKFANISILKKGSTDTLITVPIILNTELDLQHPDSIQSNIADSPFGFQSIIIYDDFNCDGIKDLAIKTGNQGCYGAPSYNVYLGNKKGTFDLNQEFTALAQQYCGFFKYDCETKTITTFKKEGSIWYQFQTYTLINGLPQLDKQVVFDNVYYPIGLMIETTWKDQIPVTRKQVGADQIRAQQLFSVKFEGNQKELLLYESTDHDQQNLYLFIVDQDNYIESEYPTLTENESSDKKGMGIFTLKKEGTKQTLSFNEGENKCSLIITPQQILYKNKDGEQELSTQNSSGINLASLLANKNWENVSIIK